jgi:hypothetical protein
MAQDPEGRVLLQAEMECGKSEAIRQLPAWLRDHPEVSEGIRADVLEEADVERRWCGNG